MLVAADALGVLQRMLDMTVEQVLGRRQFGDGYTWEHDLQVFYKRAKLDATLFGPAAAWNERIAAELPLLPTA